MVEFNKLLNKKCVFCFLLVTGFLLFLWNFSFINISINRGTSYKSVQYIEFQNYTAHQSNVEYDEKLNKSISTVACKLPVLNPFHPFMMKFMENTGPLRCQAGPSLLYKPTFFTFVNNTLRIRGPAIKSAHYEVIKRTPGNDFSVTVGDKVPISLKRSKEDDAITDTALYLPHEYIHLEFQTDKGVQHEFVLQAVPKQEVITRGLEWPKLPLNVVIVIFDSTSAANFRRKMPLSMAFLKNDSNVLLFEGQTVVGDGTTRQMSAIMTGVAEKNNPEARRGMEGADYVDKWPWIFKSAKQLNYATLFAEDTPSQGAFNLRLKGFKDPPADHFGRPFFLEAEKGKYSSADKCSGTIPKYKHSLNYVKSLYNAYPNRPKLAIAVSTLGHSSLNELEYADPGITEFLTWMREHDDNTIVFIGGDHGARFGSVRQGVQGQLEERLPFLSVLLPTWFKKRHADLYENMVANTKVLTSPFDIHATMKHIFTYPDYPKDIDTGQSYFTKIDPETRTCVEAGTPEHFCPCLVWETLDVDNEHAKEAVNVVIDYMNNQFVTYNVNNMCQKLTLDAIKRAAKQMPNDKVQRFKETFRANNQNGVPTVARYGQKGKDTLGRETLFQVQFSVLPSNGLFEATVRFQGDQAVLSENGLSRINAYGNQPHCVSKTYPHLNLFCICTDKAKL